MSTSSSSNRSRVRNLPTHCKCGLRLAKRVSWTERNPCRRFLVCPKPSVCCGFLVVFVEEINRHELGILAQERLGYVEAEFENYKARMVLQLKREQSKYAVYLSINGKNDASTKKGTIQVCCVEEDFWIHDVFVGFDVGIVVHCHLGYGKSRMKMFMVVVIL
ncbi:hypothetical protein Tco_0393715 [Tanacetum coccineum]